MLIKILDIFTILLFYLAIGSIYGLLCCENLHSKRCCSPFSKQGLLILLIYPYYILEDIINYNINENK